MTSAAHHVPSVRRAAPLPPGERRAAIVSAVLPLLIERAAQVTTRQIAEAAGVSEGTLFNVFADKDELIAAVIDAALDQGPFEQAVRQIDPAAPFNDQVVAATELIGRRIVDIWRLVSQVGSPHQPGEHRPLPVSAALTEMFARADVSLSVRPDEAALHLRALTLSLTHPMLVAEPWPAQRIVDMFLHGVELAS